jgi:hypothetical protein
LSAVAAIRTCICVSLGEGIGADIIAGSAFGALTLRIRIF